MSTQAIKAVILAALVIILLLAGKSWLNKRDKAKADAATIAQAQRTGTATVAIADKAVVAQEEAVALDNRVGAQRVEIIHRYETLKNENPTVRDFASVPVPRELRDLARDARIARDRLGGDPAGGEHDDPAKGTKRGR